MGSYPISETKSIRTEFPESGYLGHLDHHLKGQLDIDKTGHYSLAGQLTAGPDKYNFVKSKDRTALGELSTTIGRGIGEAFGSKPFDVTIKGSKPFTESGSSPRTRKATI